MLLNMMKFTNEQYDPYGSVSGEIPNSTQSIYNWKEAAVVALECTCEFFWVKVNRDKTPLFSGIILINEPVEKLSAGQLN